MPPPIPLPAGADRRPMSDGDDGRRLVVVLFGIILAGVAAGVAAAAALGAL